MKSISIVIKTLFVFLTIKFVVLIGVMFVFKAFPVPIVTLFDLTGTDDSITSQISSHAVNFATLLSSILTLYILYVWNPLERVKLDKWKNLNLKYFMLALLMGILGIAINSFVLSFFQTDYEKTVELSRQILESGWIGVIPVVFFIPIVEEIVFRKIFITALLDEMSPVWAVLLSAFMFGVLHVQPVQILGATLLGVVFGALYFLTKSLLPSILLHVFNNGLYIFNLIYPDEDQNDFLLNHNWLFWVVFLSIGVLFALVSKRLYRKSAQNFAIKKG